MCLSRKGARMPIEAKAVVDFHRELVRLPSLSGQEGEVARAVEAQMCALAYDQVTTDAWGNVTGTITGGRAGPGILLDAHMDVVPPGDIDAWQHDPFGAEVEGERVYGRGANDDKASLAAIVSMAALLERDLLVGTVYVSASVNEEVAEGAALAKVVEAVQPDFVVIGEGTDLKLGVGQKGRASVLVEATGAQAHAANPSLGINAVYKLLPALERLRALEAPSDPTLGEGLYELIELISAPYPSNSMVPYHCTARYDCRLARGETASDLVARFRDAAGDKVSVSVRQGTIPCYTGRELEIEEFLPAWMTPGDSPLVRAARRGLQSIGQAAEDFYAYFCTNGSYTAGVAGIPTVMYGPGTTEGAHMVDEYIDIADLVVATEGYAAIVEAVLGVEG